MGLSVRSSASLGTFAGHAQHVFTVVEGPASLPGGAASLPGGAASLPGIEEVSSSWQRSATKYGVDPVDNKPPHILTSGELKHLREPLDKLIFNAQEDIDQLYKVVREAGYVILFCD